VPAPDPVLTPRGLPNLIRKDDFMVSAENRDVSRRKALRKRRIARDIYRCWASLIENGGWEYYDNLHQYSKNKIHCSCPYCNAKTRNKGSRRQMSGNYQQSVHYKASDLRKVLGMDEDLREEGYYAPRHKRNRFS
jgi:hypothetical protein